MNLCFTQQTQNDLYILRRVKLTPVSCENGRGSGWKSKLLFLFIFCATPKTISHSCQARLKTFYQCISRENHFSALSFFNINSLYLHKDRQTRQ